MELWEEGYMATGESGTAHKIADYPDIDNFEEAIERFKKEKPNYIDGTHGGRPSSWACRIFPSEAEARKSFG